MKWYFLQLLIEELFIYYLLQQNSKGLSVSASLFSWSLISVGFYPYHFTRTGLIGVTHDLQTFTNAVVLSQFLSYLVWSQHTICHLYSLHTSRIQSLDFWSAPGFDLCTHLSKYTHSLGELSSPTALNIIYNSDGLLYYPGPLSQIPHVFYCIFSLIIWMIIVYSWLKLNWLSQSSH